MLASHRISTQSLFFYLPCFNIRCSSYVGKQRISTVTMGSWPYDGQEVFISPQCAFNKGEVMHQLGHALGFHHEHVRPDRDRYIEILYENIREGATRYFDILPDNEWNNLGTRYDFGSIMHFPLNKFSKNGRNTMRIRDGVEFSGEVGQRVAPSSVDIKQANLLYRCPFHRRDENSTNGELFCTK